MKRVRKTLKKYFIPHPENDHKPHLLRFRTVAFVCAVAIVAESAFLLGSRYVIPHSRFFGEIVVNALIDETNSNRTANHVSALTVNPLLAAAAQEKANDMASKGYFAHTSPTGVTPWYWFGNVGYAFSYAGENLAVNFSDSKDVTNAWMNSPLHRENILDSHFTEIGIATAQGNYNGKPAIYVVELFGTPAATPIAFVNNASAETAPQSAAIPVPPPAVPKGISSAQTLGASASTTPVVTKPVATPATTTQPAPLATAVPTVVVVTDATTSNAQTNSLAVKGAATETAPQSEVPPLTVRESNPIQTAFSDPKRMANYFYIFLIALFAVGLALNTFIQIRIQYPNLIFGGLLVIVIAGLFIVLNQNVAFFHPAVL